MDGGVVVERGAPRADLHEADRGAHAPVPRPDPAAAGLRRRRAARPRSRAASAPGRSVGAWPPAPTESPLRVCVRGACSGCSGCSSRCSRSSPSSATSSTCSASASSRPRTSSATSPCSRRSLAVITLDRRGHLRAARAARPGVARHRAHDGHGLRARLGHRVRAHRGAGVDPRLPRRRAVVGHAAALRRARARHRSRGRPTASSR